MGCCVADEVWLNRVMAGFRIEPRLPVKVSRRFGQLTIQPGGEAHWSVQTIPHSLNPVRSV